jgi:hypothetical protein
VRENHGEDVKEYYFYLDSTPTHSYMKYLYKDPQAAFPYDDLVQTTAKRTKFEQGYELIDTKIFDEDKYFDVFVEYAKADVDDVLVRITVANRGPEAASLHLLPTLWFRSTWFRGQDPKLPELKRVSGKGTEVVSAWEPRVGQMFLHCEGAGELLFTNNESNEKKLWGGQNLSPHVKDAFHEYLVDPVKDAVNPAGKGTKAAAHYKVTVQAGSESVVRLRLSRAMELKGGLGEDFDDVFAEMIRDADSFYEGISPKKTAEKDRRIMRQLWSKQFYYFDVDLWLREHGYNPTGGRQKDVRNAPWYHMINSDIISMPDKWECPWYAAWDLAFHTATLAMVDVDFAKNQLELMVSEAYVHPNGQLPAYEWNFSDVNPPVHVWAVLYVYLTEKSCFGKLLLNFTWWVNRKERGGKNVFESVTAEDVLEEGSSSLINKQPVAKTEALIPGEPVTMN